MSKYDEMSDFEINKAVGILINRYVFTDGDLVYLDEDTEFDFNPCNNPSDAWPIILGNGISINKWDKSDSFWTADVEHPKSCDEYNTIEVKHENPLRAAAICFLIMKDAES